MGGRALILAPDRLLRIAGKGKGGALSQGCFIGSCGCVCIKKMATTDTLRRYSMGGCSCCLQVGLCPGRVC